MKYLISILIIIIGVFAVSYFWSNKTIPVLTKQLGAMDEYYLYVPNDNGKSTCTWSYLDEKGNPATFTTNPDTQLYKTGEHDFVYGSQTEKYTNVKVECLSSSGVKYTGSFN